MKTIREFVYLGLACGLAAILFLVYMLYIGIPKTQARNYYNLAQREISKENKEKAVYYLGIANSYWNEIYIEDELKSLNNRF